jgi:peptidyl-prolyl cis-trans isomerase B (cyclophilin B)
MIRESRLLTALVCFPLCVQLMFAPAVQAQDEKAESEATKTPAESEPLKTPAGEEKPKPPAEPLKTPALKVTVDSGDEDSAESWKKLLARKLAIFEQLQALKKRFAAAATSDEKRSIREQFTDLIREFQISVSPQMLDLAATIYEQNEGDLDAGEIVMQDAFNRNDYDRSAEVASKLLVANRKTKNVLSMAGVSQFALHNFEQAHAILSEAQKANRLDFRYGGYIEAAEKYGEFWKAEQEIRAKEDALEGDAALPRVEFDTERGKIVFELFEDHAPNTVANMISLVEGGKYDGIAFHRIENGFMAQGGDPNSLNEDPSDDGFGGPGYSIKCECYREDTRMHFRGSLSMAHSGPDTGGSQFFITHLPTEWLNVHTEPEKGGHTVYGRVIEGMKVAASLNRGDRITKATVLRKRPHDYKPVTTPDEKPETTPDEKTDEKPAEKTDEKPSEKSDEKPEGSNSDNAKGDASKDADSEDE